MDDEEKFQAKISKFRAAFPLAAFDRELDVDAKHKQILKESSLSEIWMQDLNYRNLKNWHMQGDMGAPPSWGALIRSGFMIFKEAPLFFYRVLFHRKLVKELRGSIADDLSAINYIGGLDLLQANPVHLTPGNAPYVLKRNTSYNSRWLRYIYISTQIRKFQLIEGDAIWVDIGSYYGGLQSIIKKWHPQTSIILVDFHHQLLRSYIFLSEMFPDSIHNLGIAGNTQKIQPGTITYIPVTEFSDLNQLNVTLITNFFSFGEMKRSDYDSYISSPVVQNSKFIYSINRFVSAPFFDPTYDSDLTVWDYRMKDFASIYFDVFPIHHFLAIKRKLWGQIRYRNVSSSYFEFIQSRTSR